MANLIDAQNQVNVQKETTIAVVDLKNSLGEQFKEVFKLLIDNNTISADTLNQANASGEENNNKIDILIDKTKEIVNTNNESNSSLTNLVNTDAQIANKPDTENAKTQSLLSRIGGNLKDYVKTSVKNRFDKSKFGKLVNFVKDISKDTKKQAKQKNQPAALAAKPGGPAPAPQLNSGLIANTMATTMSKTLTPGAMVGAFLAKVLPLIIIFGLLLFLFLTSFFDMDVGTAIMVTLGIIVAIIIFVVLAYIAFQYAKAIILFAFQMVCEVIKLAMAAGVNGIAIVAIMAIMFAFIIIAPLILIAIIIAFAIIVAAFVLITYVILDAIVQVIQALLNFVLAIIELPLKILETLGKIVTGVLSLIFGKGKDASEEATEKASEKLLNHQLMLHDFIKMTLDKFIGKLVAALAVFGIFVDKDENETAFSKALAPLLQTVDSINGKIGGAATSSEAISSSNPFGAMIAPLISPIEEFRKSFENYAKLVLEKSTTIVASSAPSNTNVNSADYSYPSETNNINNNTSEISSSISSGSGGIDSETREAIKEIAKFIKEINRNSSKAVDLLKSNNKGSFLGFSL